MKHLGYNAGNALKHYFKTHPGYVPADDPAIDNQDMMFFIGATQQASQCEEQDCDGWAILLAGTFTAMQDLASELIPGSPQSQYGHDSADPDCAGCGYQKSYLELDGNYSPSYANKIQKIYRIFKESGLSITEHAINRILGRAGRGVTVDNVMSAAIDGAEFFDPKYGTVIHFKDGVAVSLDPNTGTIVSVQTQTNPTARWIPRP